MHIQQRCCESVTGMSLSYVQAEADKAKEAVEEAEKEMRQQLGDRSRSR